jgi:hypothetical protein
MILPIRSGVSVANTMFPLTASPRGSLAALSGGFGSDVLKYVLSPNEQFKEFLHDSSKPIPNRNCPRVQRYS